MDLPKVWALQQVSLRPLSGLQSQEADMNKLHFKGDHRGYVPNRIVGPDNWGAWYLPVSAHFFDGYTTIFYKPVPPDKLPPQAAMLSKQVMAQRQREGNTPWPHMSGPLTPPRSPESLLQYQISRRSGSRQTQSGAKGLTKSQKALLKRLRKRG